MTEIRLPSEVVDAFDILVGEDPPEIALHPATFRGERVTVLSFIESAEGDSMTMRPVAIMLTDDMFDELVPDEMDLASATIDPTERG